MLYNKGNTPKWIDMHIKPMKSVGMFVTFDETDTNVIGYYNTYNDAVVSIMKHAEYLETYRDYYYD